MSEISPDVEMAVPVSTKSPHWGFRILLLCLGLAATGLVSWYVMQRESPTIVVQRFCSALKGGRYAEAYTVIDWPEGRHPSEEEFVSKGNTLSKVVTIQQYKLGEPRKVGDTTIVPVDVKLSLITLLGSRERDERIDVECRFLKGKWMVRLDLNKGLLGLGKMIMPGAK